MENGPGFTRPKGAAVSYPIDNRPVCLRPKSAAERLSLSVATINRALAKGELTRIKRGSATLIAVDELDAWARGDTPAAADSRA